MYYLIYLASMFLFLIGAACSSSAAYPLHFYPAQLLNYIDLRSFIFILAPCLLVLFCTKSFQNFGHAFLYMLGKKSTFTKDSMHSVTAVMLTSVVAGTIHAIIVIICLLRSMDPKGISYVGSSVHIALLSFLYPLILCMILLPVLLSGWKYKCKGRTVRLQKVQRKNSR